MRFIIMLILSPCFLFSQKQVSVDQYKQMIEEALNSDSKSSALSPDIRIERISGTVNISTSYEEETTLSNNYQYPIETGDVIKTASDGAVNIYINNTGIIRLERNSEIEISDASNDIIFSLSSGIMIAKIERLKERMTLRVKTPQALCVISGGEFAIEHTKFKNETVAGIFDEGEMKVYPGEDENEENLLKLSKNNEVSLSSDSRHKRVIKLSKLSSYKRYISDDKKRLINYKKKWKRFSASEKEKYRQSLFAKKANQRNKKTAKNKDMEE